MVNVHLKDNERAVRPRCQQRGCLMKNFMDDQDFLLSTKTGEELFHNFAEGMPIVDYHCHISPKEIWETSVSRTSPRFGWAATTTSGA